MKELSFKKTLEYYIQKNGSMNLQELESLCKTEKHKMSHGERQLRDSIKEELVTTERVKNAIVLYKWAVFTPAKTEGARRFLDQWKTVEEPVKQEVRDLFSIN